MKLIIALAALLVAALAAPQQRNPEADAVIVKLVSDNIGVDGYNFEYQTSNQISQSESGRLLNPGTDQEEMRVEGEYSYPGPDGPIITKYVADKDGFRAFGDHIPK